MSDLFSKERVIGTLSKLIMAGVILSAPFMIPLMESKGFEGEDMSALTLEVLNLMALNHKPLTYKVSSSTPQFVLFSFDGSKSVDMLKETLGFEKNLSASGTPIKFTYFINADYFLTDKNAAIYRPPKAEPGTSMIGYAASAEDIALRVKTFNEAVLSGNEVGSHAAGHFNGHSWTEEDWKKEFNAFKSIIYNVQANNPSADIEAPTFLKSVVGFRAPDLGVDEDMYATLRDFGFVYDASGIGSAEQWPKKDLLGIWHIPLAIMRLGPKQTPVISMDYSIWMTQAGGKENAAKGSALWDRYYQEVVDAYLSYFNSNYYGTRAPVIIANHFTKMEDGVYWEAMKTVAREVCGLENVRCTTFGSFVDYLNLFGVPATKAEP